MRKLSRYLQQSLKRRAVIYAAFVVIVFLTIAGLALQQAFTKSIKQNAESAMQAQIVSILSVLDINQNGSIQIDTVPFPELSIPNSGMYAEIWNQQSLLWRSDSLIGLPLPEVSAVSESYTFQDNKRSDKKFTLSTIVEWRESSELIYKLKFISAVDSEPYIEQIRNYKRSISLWLGILGVVLVLLQAFLFSWLFRPLIKVVDELSEIEQGERDLFDDDYPIEIKGLTNSLNQYVQHERNQIAKQKALLGNLAHSLKTPVAVIKNAVNQQVSDKHLINDQLVRIDNAIEYQLNKVNLATRQRFNKGIAVADDIKRVVNAIDKLNKISGKHLISEIDDDVEFYGELGDLVEVIGNLLENANKWASKNIYFSLGNTAGSRRIQILVIDDGSGIAIERRKSVTQRGMRLDQKTEGHGIGLSIVADIIESYGGTLEFDDASGQYAGHSFNSGLHVKVSF